jgi:antitoxin VapB
MKRRPGVDAGLGELFQGVGKIFRPLDVTAKQAYVMAYAQEIAMYPERHVKLFKNGRNQAVRIPREFELPGEDAVMRKEGNRLIIEPVPPKSLLALLATWEPIDEEFPEIEDLPPDPVEL